MTKAITRYRPLRLATVTLGLCGAGALFGGLAGSLGLAIALLLQPATSGFGSFDFCGFAGTVGACLGVVCAPVTTWIMLRHVPLGRVFAVLTAGTIAGGVFGWFAFAHIDLVFGPTLSALLAFIVTAVALSFSKPQSTQAPQW